MRKEKKGQPRYISNCETNQQQQKYKKQKSISGGARTRSLWIFSISLSSHITDSVNQNQLSDLRGRSPTRYHCATETFVEIECFWGIFSNYLSIILQSKKKLTREGVGTPDASGCGERELGMRKWWWAEGKSEGHFRGTRHCVGSRKTGAGGVQ